MPEILSRKRLLCGHRPGAAGSPENLIGGDKASPGDNISPCSQGPKCRDPQLVSGRTAGPGPEATAWLKQSSARSPGHRPRQACPKPLDQLDFFSALQPHKGDKRHFLDRP